MLTRRVALLLAALTALAATPVLAGAAPASASGAVAPSPMARGNDDGEPDGPSSRSKEPVDECPTEQWTLPLELKGLACILLLPKPDQGEEGGGGLGGLGGLFG